MPRGEKSSYAGEQKRQAEHIERSVGKRGTGQHEAERRAWATVTESSGGRKGGSPARKKKPA